MRAKLFQIAILLFFFSCTNKKGGAGAEAVYAEYTITGEEGAENVTCVLKFFGSRHSTTALLLEPPAVVLFDGTAVNPDSAGLNGAYYEVQKPLTQFAGPHTIIFKNTEEKIFKDDFSFQPFSIASDLNETIPRGDLSISLEGVPTNTPIRVVLTDTSFATPDINDIDTVQNGKLILTREALQNVADGPVTLHVYREEERPLNSGLNGVLSITYDVSRTFELVGK